MKAHGNLEIAEDGSVPGPDTSYEFRADKFAYLALNSVWVVFAIFFTGAFFFGKWRGSRDVWPYVLLCWTVSIIVFFVIRSYRVTINAGRLTYRFMFHRTKSVNLSEIRTARIDLPIFNRRRPPYALVIEPISGSITKTFSINFKFLSRKDLRTLFCILGDKVVGEKHRVR